MCYSCWENEGKPAIINSKVCRAAALIRGLYQDHDGGGHLHIVTDDYNIEQENVDWCVDHMTEATDIELRCGKALQAMSEEERGSAIALWEGFIDDQGEEV